VVALPAERCVFLLVEPAPTPQASDLSPERFDLIAGGARNNRIYDLGERAERDGRMSGMLGDFREADAMRWNSLLSESVLPPTCAPQTLQAWSYLVPVGSTKSRLFRTGFAVLQRGQ
jgi:hypothetical protein